jgi:hypothetical protein
MKFNIRPTIQPTILRMLALGLATLMAILVIGRIRAIARVDDTNLKEAAAQVQSQNQPVQNQPAETDLLTPLTEWDTDALGELDKELEQSDNSAASQASQSPPASTAKASSKGVPPSQASAGASRGQSAPNSSAPNSTASSSYASVSMASYTPPQEAAPADTTNYGDRYATDIYGNALNNDWLIVLHETVGTADGAIRTFQTPHPNDDDQVSYHTLIRLNGTIVYIVPPEKRAYGAGNSAFQTPSGLETVRTDPRFPPSVNNFAYHISLETPPDGHHDNPTHSGYTREQYQSLAWLISKTPVPDDRITTHQAVDQSGSRMDPRSFNAQQFFALLHAFPDRNINRVSEGG